MKNILLFSLLCFTTSLIGQTRQDTVYTQSGKIANIKHFSKINTKEVSKSYLFQRGLTFGDEAWQIDSISAYNSEGKPIHSLPIHELDPGKRKLSNTKSRSYRQESPVEQQRHQFTDRFSAIDLINISGYAGKEGSGTLKLWIKGKEDYPITVLENPARVSIKGLGKTLSPGANNFDLSVELSPGVSQQVIRLAGPDHKVYDIRLALRGYDLTEADFTAGNTHSKLKQIDASEREHLFLRLESTEKLLNLYHGDKLRFRIPVGRQIDQIPVYHLPPGDYRMEIIDLGTGVKRSYGLKR